MTDTIYKLADGSWTNEEGLLFEYLESTDQLEKYKLFRKSITEELIELDN